MGFVLLLYLCIKEWAVPAVTCGELDMKRAATALFEGRHCDGSRIALKACVAKDRSMLILWKWPKGGGAQRQLLQMIIHTLKQEDKDRLHKRKPNHITQPYDR